METTHENKKIAIASIVGFVVGFALCWVIIDAKSNEVKNTNDGILTDDKAMMIKDTPTSANPDTTTDQLDNELNRGSNSNVNINTTTSVNNLPTVSENIISISDQSAGSTVSIDVLALTERSWAVVYEDMRGRPGSILGAHRYLPGLHTDATVELQRVSEVGNVYYGMIHRDDGNDEFDHNTDVPLTDESGGPLMIRFMSTAIEYE
jgi:hypothetical protein